MNLLTLLEFICYLLHIKLAEFHYLGKNQHKDLLSSNTLCQTH